VRRGTAGGEGAEGLIGRDEVRAGLNRWANNRILKAVGAERGQLSKLSEERINGLADFLHDEGLIKPGQSRQDIGDVIEAAHAVEGLAQHQEGRPLAEDPHGRADRAKVRRCSERSSKMPEVLKEQS
jgi:polyhydroxyalkanoate synthesis regulator phasin